MVNDDPVQLAWLTEVVGRAGYEARAHLSPVEAVEALGGEPAPDLILLDLHMPELDGWKVCRLLRSPDFAHLADVPILVVSATYSGADVEEISGELGADAFLTLPCSPDQLQTRMGSLLSREMDPWTPCLLEADLREPAPAPTGDAAPGAGVPGYRVSRVRSLDAAREAVEALAPEVVVLRCSAVTLDLLGFLAALQDRVAPPIVVALRGADGEGSPVALLRAGADALLPPEAGPEEVAEVVARARRGRSLLRVEAILEQRTRELRRSERRLRTLVECLPDAVVVVDAGGGGGASNRVAAATMGAWGAPGASLRRAFRPQDRAPFDAWMLRGMGAEQEEVLLCRSAHEVEPRVWELRGVHLEEEGEASRLLLLCRDLTERIREEEERLAFQRRVEHAQRLESLGVMAGGIAHDFNNLLVAMLGHAALARTEVEPGGEVDEHLSRIETAARRASDLTHQILTFSGKASVSPRTLDLGGLITEMEGLLGPALPTRAQLRLDVGPGPLFVKGDPAQLRQVVMNLVLNAAEALEGSGGEVRLRGTAVAPSEAPAPDRLRLTDLPEGPLVCLEVADQGRGMESGVLDRIFEPFFTTKARGRGLGLAALLGIIRSHRGGVVVDSSPGLGTTFRVYLPQASAEAPSPEPEPAPPRSAGEGTVLVVDDEEGVRRFACLVLERSGYQTLMAADGVEAMEIMEGPEGARVGCILLDLAMPRLDGFETLQALRTVGFTLPVILSSGHPPGHYRGDLLRMAQAFLPKPYGPRDLLERVEALLG